MCLCVCGGGAGGSISVYCLLLYRSKTSEATNRTAIWRDNLGYDFYFLLIWLRDCCHLPDLEHLIINIEPKHSRHRSLELAIDRGVESPYSTVQYEYRQEGTVPDQGDPTGGGLGPGRPRLLAHWLARYRTKFLVRVLVRAGGTVYRYEYCTSATRWPGRRGGGLDFYSVLNMAVPFFFV